MKRETFYSQCETDAHGKNRHFSLSMWQNHLGYPSARNAYSPSIKILTVGKGLDISRFAIFSHCYVFFFFDVMLFDVKLVIAVSLRFISGHS